MKNLYSLGHTLTFSKTVAYYTEVN